MGGDRRRDRQQSEVGSTSSPPRHEGMSSESRDDAIEVEFEGPTRPGARTVGDSELSAEPQESVSAPPLLAAQDSLHPVRVPARSLRPLSLWTRGWATSALVIVVAGGAIGIVASLRTRTIVPIGRGASKVLSHSAAAAQKAPARGVQATEIATRADQPAAAPGITAPSPLAPLQAANRSAASPVSAVEAPPMGSSPGAASARASPSAVAFRTPESLAVSPGAPPTGAARTLPRRPKPAQPTPPSMAIPLPSDESVHAPTPAPATSDTPQKKGESEDWVTEERRF